MKPISGLTGKKVADNHDTPVALKDTTKAQRARMILALRTGHALEFYSEDNNFWGKSIFDTDHLLDMIKNYKHRDACYRVKR